jgi:hypothetical protein
MAILRDYRCSLCGDLSEDMEPVDACHCGGVKLVEFSYHPTQVMDPVMATVMSKGSQIRKRLQGRLPWRKSSYSQSD